MAGIGVLEASGDPDDGGPAHIVVLFERELHSIDPTAAIENVKTLEQIRE